MNSLNAARRLADGGRFAEALATLDRSPINRSDQIGADVLRAELLERTGRLGQSRTLVEQLLKSKEISLVDRSRSECVIGRIEIEEGNLNTAFVHMQRSVDIAKRSNNLECICWSQVRLIPSLSDCSSPDSIAPLVTELRSNAMKLGKPRVMAALHIFVGQAEAKRGLLDSARRHTRIGLETLTAEPDLALEAMAETTLLNVAIARSEFDIALTHARRGARVAHECGAAIWRRTFLANAARLFFLTGRFDEAVDQYEQAFRVFSSSGDSSIGSLCGLAELRLTQGRIDDCVQLFDRVEQSAREPSHRAPYCYRHTLPVRSQLLARQRHWIAALETIDTAFAVADTSGDHLLRKMAVLTKAELLQQSQNPTGVVTALDNVIVDLTSYPHLCACYERILACALAITHNDYAARSHFDRAKRVCESIHYVPGLIELDRCWDLAIARRPDVGTAAADSESEPATRGRTSLQGAAAIMLHSARPELVAREVVNLLHETDCVWSATAISRGPAGEAETLASIGDPSAPHRGQLKQLYVGVSRDRAVELLLDPKADLESTATLNAISFLLTTVHDLERARIEREERLTLWPIDDVPLDNGHAVVSGQMRELMTFARRVATTGASVLITGESGTGKEILARAIHSFSDRSHKPFLPFNCSAIPREMLESQLFGHRRGSFTGADRDQPGLIRSAVDGTLFLDEIGELDLDLQPKLLRFLESGEICPLGETAPFIVDVRIIAATNSNLEASVKDGRFRDDLFYRLNVIRLRIPPLRERRDEIAALVSYFVGRAAAEFRKGQMRVAEETMEHLQLYAWPGNVRQLHNELRRMIALSDGDSVLTPAQLSADILNARPAPDRRVNVNGGELVVPLHDKLLPTLARIENEMVRTALREHHGKVDAAAKALGISRKGLYLKRQRLGL